MSQPESCQADPFFSLCDVNLMYPGNPEILFAHNFCRKKTTKPSQVKFQMAPSWKQPNKKSCNLELKVGNVSSILNGQVKTYIVLHIQV